MSYSEKYLKIIIGLGTGQMGDGKPTEYHTLTNYRTTTQISAYGGETMGQANVRIYGVSLDLMNKLTTTGFVMTQVRGQNSIQIFAGEDPQSLTDVYSGTIWTAMADYNSAPDVALEIVALSSTVAAMSSAHPTSLPGQVSSDNLFSKFANDLGLKLNNIDVVHAFNNPTFNGTIYDQILAAAREAGCDVTFGYSFLNIKKYFSKFGDTPTIVSPKTGMVGYPILGSDYMHVKSLFLPTVGLGTQIKIEDSQLAAANGLWIVNSVVHELDSMMPNGKWFTTCGVYGHGLS